MEHFAQRSGPLVAPWTWPIAAFASAKGGERPRPEIQLRACAVCMVHISALQVKGLLVRRQLQVALNRLLLHAGSLQTQAQAPGNHEVLRQAPEEHPQHQALDHQDDAEGNAQVGEHPIGQGSTSNAHPRAPAALIGLNLNPSCTLQQCHRRHHQGVLAHMLQGHSIHTLSILLLLNRAEAILSHVVANAQLLAKLIESLHSQALAAKVGQVVLRVHSMQAKELPLRAS